MPVLKDDFDGDSLRSKAFIGVQGRRGSLGVPGGGSLFQIILLLAVRGHSIIRRGDYAHQMMRVITVNFPRDASGATNQAGEDGRDPHKGGKTSPARLLKCLAGKER